MAHNSGRKTARWFHSVDADSKPKRTKIDESMENIIISDDVLHNILSRLSAKPLMRFRCVSKHWNSLIADPYFINSRSRRMILLTSYHLGYYALDDKHPNVVNLTYYFENKVLSNVVGTFNGMLILALQNPSSVYIPSIFFLYNPLTRAAKKLPDPPYNPCCLMSLVACAYGFGQVNIIIARHPCGCTSNNESYCNIFSLKKGLWTTPKTTFQSQCFLYKVGMYLNVFLHLIQYVNVFRVVALDVKEMVVTSADEPPLSSDYYHLKSSVLGKLHGCLCIISKWRNGFDVWVMMKKNKEQGEWSKQYSFALPFYRCCYEHLLNVCILEDGRIAVGDDVSNQIIICHLSERYYDIFECASKIWFDTGFEYVESPVSPSDICNVF